LTNITKHAQATQVHMTLVREDQGVRFRIVDDGRGIAEGALAKPKSHGVVGMRERMRQLGGTFSISRGPNGKGTLIEAYVPLTAVAERAEEPVGKILRPTG
ncbi:MAG TPA: ATP-binding protein, partial [Steroidobacteraceae bacterium]|nr:ATP-binding protein [Steroidobacteraceae bacterium]